MSKQESYIFRAAWPITDIDRTRSALIAEACRELDAMAAEAGCRLVGEPEWVIDGEELTCEAPAVLLDNVIPMRRPAGRRGVKPDRDVVADMRLLVSREEWTHARIAAHYGVSVKTVARYLAGEVA